MEYFFCQPEEIDETESTIEHAMGGVKQERIPHFNQPLSIGSNHRHLKNTDVALDVENGLGQRQTTEKYLLKASIKSNHRHLNKREQRQIKNKNIRLSWKSCQEKTL